MSALLEKAKDLQSTRLFQEAFNVASFSMYYSLGFTPVADLLDLFTEPGPRNTPDIHKDVSELGTADLESLDAYDRPRSGFTRRHDLAYYLRWGKVFVHRHGSDIRGFLACLPAAQSVQLGPLVAEGEEEASHLYHHAARAFSGLACQTRLMATNRLLVESLQALGFRVYCVNLLMVRGSWRPGTCVEAFGRFPEGA